VNGNLQTHGKQIFSYALKIGSTLRGPKGEEQKVGIDYRGKVSRTTSAHCTAVAKEADRFVSPEEFDRMLRDGWQEIA
jgi:hypothetical protein